MPDTAKVIPIATDRHDRDSEEHRANIRRLVHEFATYAVWHLSFTKPDAVALRILLNDLFREWTLNEFTCGDPSCPYCKHESHSFATRTGFRSIYRKLIGRKNGGTVHG